MGKWQRTVCVSPAPAMSPDLTSLAVDVEVSRGAKTREAAVVDQDIRLAGRCGQSGSVLVNAQVGRDEPPSRSWTTTVSYQSDRRALADVGGLAHDGSLTG